MLPFDIHRGASYLLGGRPSSGTPSALHACSNCGDVDFDIERRGAMLEDDHVVPLLLSACGTRRPKKAV